MDMMQLYAVTLLLALSRFSGAQLQSSVERPCPGERVTFTCTISSVGHQWNIPSLNITRGLLPSSQGRVISDHPPFQFTVTEVMTGSITSTATVTATVNLNGTLVVCRDGVNGSKPEKHNTIKLSGPPSVPTLSCVDSSEDVSGTVIVTVSWTLSGGDSADSYLINITTNAPQTPYGGLLNITTASVTQHELTGFMAGYEYNITVRGVNCGSQEGTESEPLTITPQVPAKPSSCNITLSYNQSSGRLLFINSTWTTVPDPGGPCQGVSGNISQYQVSFQNAFSVPDTENVKIASCTAERCSHTFEPPSNPPSSYDSVSVAAENVVGVGTARTCTAQTISSTNHLLTGEVVSVNSPSDARLNCRFLSGFAGSAHCTVQYGTDPTYMNLPYSAESTETGTAGDTVSVVLRERLNSSTVYYYTVSAVSDDVTVRVQGNFRTPQYSCKQTELWNLPVAGATFLPDVSSLNISAAQYPSCDADSVGSAVLLNTTLNTATVAFYTGTTPGSRACLVCDEGSGYELNTTANERVCQSDGTWSGNSLVCECRLTPWNIPLIVMSALAMVATLVGTIVTIHDGMTVCHIHLREQDQTITKCCSDIRKDIRTDWRNQCWLALLVSAVIFCVIGVALWITVGVIVSNLPNGNACDPNWRSTRDGLITSAIGAFIVAYIFAAAAVWIHVYYHKKDIEHHKSKCSICVLLVIALILTLIGVGVWSASAVLFYIHCGDGNSDETDCDETDGDERSHTKTNGSEDMELKENKQNEEVAGSAVEETSKQSKQKKSPLDPEDSPHPHPPKTNQENAAPPPRPTTTPP